MVVDRFQGKVDVALRGVHAQDLADHLLTFPDEVSDVLYPASGYVPDVDESFLVVVLVE